MNPDATINVCAVYPDGTVVVYDHAPKDETARRQRIRAEHFPNYGSAKLWADEYEAKQRRDRDARAK